MTSAVFGPGQGRILLDEVNCGGTETTLEHCSHQGFYNHDCQHSEDIGIICYNCKTFFFKKRDEYELIYASYNHWSHSMC